jgi:hypothetical protein
MEKKPERVGANATFRSVNYRNVFGFGWLAGAAGIADSTLSHVVFIFLPCPFAAEQ